MIHTLGQEDIEEAVQKLARSSRPGTFYMELRNLTVKFLATGNSREVLLDSYEHVAKVLGDEDEELEDEVLEVMAELEGWSAPHARL
jgi:hypothetical protein